MSALWYSNHKTGIHRHTCGYDCDDTDGGDDVDGDYGEGIGVVYTYCSDGGGWYDGDGDDMCW